jgi:cytochrome c peroxidase
VYRRPLPATNLVFSHDVIWDLRETLKESILPPFTPDVTGVASLREQLRSQAINATVGHAQAMAPGLSSAQVQSIVDFELSLFSAQTRVIAAEDLASDGASGGLLALSKQPVTPVCGNLPVYSNNPMYPQCQQYTFDPNAFTLFKVWEQLQGDTPKAAMRASIARGQVVFNTKKTASPTKRDAIFYDHAGDNKNLSCSTCHGAFNVGGGTIPVSLANVSVGVAASVINAPNAPVDTLDKTLPYYKLRCNANGMAAFIGARGNVGCHDGSEPGIPVDEITLNDPARAAISGGWTATGGFKAPTLRNLSARAPYFHAGSAATLADVVDHYKRVLGFEFTGTEEQDLVNFLSAL